ncbi:MAG: sigma-54 interaction domain-containing protein [Gemmatimonadaceae bacterium]
MREVPNESMAVAIKRLRELQALDRFVGESPVFLDAIDQLPILARSNASVVVSGETGTGKELVARAIHYLGGRAARPFIPVNCGSLPDSLLEAELFGHERGAFTDARQRRTGLIAQAHGGTLFLDEVDTLSARAQVALLRVLQDRTVRALGSDREQTVDVRFVAATNVSLGALVHEGRFRSDLYFRLYVLTVDLPPLRSRQKDVLLLARHFIQRYAEPGADIRLTDDAERALLRHRWPGNVRELENVIHRALTLAPLDGITARDLGLEASPATAAHLTASAAPLPAAVSRSDVLLRYRDAKRAAVDAFERDYLTRLMRAHRGNITRAAVASGKERRDLGRLLKKYRLNPRLYA